MLYPNGIRNQSRSRRYWNLALLCLLVLLIPHSPTSVQAQSSDVVCGKFEQVAGSSDTTIEGAGGGSAATFLFTVTTETGRSEVWEVHPLATVGYEHLIGQYVRIRQPDLSSGGGDDGKPLLLGFADYEIVASCGPTAQPTATRARPTATPKPTLAARTARAGECGANNDLPPNCGCASFVALQQFGGKVTGNWPDANSLADQKYWNDGFVQYKCATTWRYRNDVPLAGDVMIVQGGSKYWLMPGGRAQTAVAAGHTGFVRSASYSSQKSFPKDANKYSGWQVMLRSANWGCYDKATFSDGKCQNVNEVPVFLPNGDNVSFWRSIKTPRFYTIVPAGQTNKKALAPAVDPTMMPGVVQQDPQSRGRRADLGPGNSGREGPAIWHALHQDYQLQDRQMSGRIRRLSQ